jgi:Zn-dependent M28 family amino/carboxypeptidase
VAIASVSAVAAAHAATFPVNESQGFRKAVTVAGIRDHQSALQAIANNNDGIRTSGTAGFDASAQYVYDKLVAAGYSPSFQEFSFQLAGDRTPPVFQRVSPSPATFVDGVDFATMQYSGSGDVTATLTAVDLIVPAPGLTTSGCEASDFAGFPAGSIALMQRGTCSFRTKAANALAAGASAAVIFNDGGDPSRQGIIRGTFSPPDTILNLPTVGTTFALGDSLRNGVLNGPTGVTVRLKTDLIAETRTTKNVIAETAGGDPDRVVVVGAHLDSVTGGPGINDNGSGSATILEIAEQFAARGIDPRNKLRFMWYGAEEFSLLGSTHYVDSLSQAEQDQIELMLNFDMVGSPNFVRFVYDGNNSAGGGTVGPTGSGAIEQVFLDYFAALGLATDPTPFNGRSDYGPFIAKGIPAGGLFTGAEGIKTAAQAATYGGTAGVPFDPCYHLGCDTFANFNSIALDQMSDAAAHAVLAFAKRKFDKEPLIDP